jgi:hypothetical protein
MTKIRIHNNEKQRHSMPAPRPVFTPRCPFPSLGGMRHMPHPMPGRRAIRRAGGTVAPPLLLLTGMHGVLVVIDGGVVVEHPTIGLFGVWRGRLYWFGWHRFLLGFSSLLPFPSLSDGDRSLSLFFFFFLDRARNDLSLFFRNEMRFEGKRGKLRLRFYIKDLGAYTRFCCV